jgi:hypothetical protein
VEWIDLDRGIPLRAVEILNGRPVSVTEFVMGKPVSQRADLDCDSRMETIRRFRAAAVAPVGAAPVGAAVSGAAGTTSGEAPWEDPLDYKKIVEFSESDWNGDGIFETSEEYLLDGSVVYSWDMDGDGVREYSETETRD